MINVLVIFGKSAVMSTRCSRKGAALSAVSSLGGLYKCLVFGQFFLRVAIQHTLVIFWDTFGAAFWPY